MDEDKSLFDSSYLTLWDSGYIGISDGVGFVGTIEGEELKELYKALSIYFKEKEGRT